MLAGFIFFLAIVALVLSIAAGYLNNETDDFPFVVFLLVLLSSFALVTSHALLGEDINNRWEAWAECEDQVTVIESVRIEDCDEYYNAPLDE